MSPSSKLLRSWRWCYCWCTVYVHASDSLPCKLVHVQADRQVRYVEGAHMSQLQTMWQAHHAGSCVCSPACRTGRPAQNQTGPGPAGDTRTAAHHMPHMQHMSAHITHLDNWLQPCTCLPCPCMAVLANTNTVSCLQKHSGTSPGARQVWMMLTSRTN